MGGYLKMECVCLRNQINEQRNDLRGVEGVVYRKHKDIEKKQDMILDQQDNVTAAMNAADQRIEKVSANMDSGIQYCLARLKSATAEIQEKNKEQLRDFKGNVSAFCSGFQELHTK